MNDIPIGRLREVLDHVLRPLHRVAAVYAYGSRVEGRALPLSDLDLAVVVDPDREDDDPLLAERISARTAMALGTAVEIDAHLAHELPLTVRGRVVTGGVLVYEADPSRRLEFETSTRRLYFDFLPLIERDAREGLLSGG